MDRLVETRKQYRSGSLSKPEYIDAMHTLHQQLFEYTELLGCTDIEKIEILENQVIMTSRQYGIRLLCDHRDKRTAPVETLNFDWYEPQESSMVLGLLKDGMTMLDIGANIGWYSLVIAKLFPNTDVHAFEPIPHIYRTLAENIALNNRQNIRTYNQGFSNQAGEAVFYFSPDLGVNASLRNVSSRNAEDIEETRCVVDTVDHFTDRQSLIVDFIKCDVEGAEYLVFQGARQTLERDKPIIFSELLRKWSAQFDYHPNEMIQFLTQLGYDCFTVNHQTLLPFKAMDENTIETNFFFLHREKHAHLIQQFAMAAHR